METAADADVGQTRRLLTPRPGPPLLPAATWVGSWSLNCNFLSREEHRLSALCKPLSCVLRQGVRQVPLSSSFAREETEAQEKSPSGMEEPQPRAGSNRELTFSCTSASTAPHPGAPQEQHPVSFLSLSPAPSSQAAGGGPWQDSVELSGNCPASPHAITLLLCTALHTCISLPHARLSVSCTDSLQL